MLKAAMTPCQLAFFVLKTGNGHKQRFEEPIDLKFCAQDMFLDPHHQDHTIPVKLGHLAGQRFGSKFTV